MCCPSHAATELSCPFHSLVPDQTVEYVHQLICEHLHNEFAKLNTKCEMIVTKVGDGTPWLGNVNHPGFKAAKQATEVWRDILMLVMLYTKRYD
jgi:hypothetical protein